MRTCWSNVVFRECHLVVLVVLVSGTPGHALTNYIGYNGVNWDTRGKVSWRSSSAHPSRTFDYAINGFGIKGDGSVHSNMVYGDPPPAPGQGATITMAMFSALSASLPNPRGGTLPGGHWVEFAFDQAYPVDEMWIWNVNENTLFNGSGGGTDYPVNTWTIQGVREVTIQATAVGGGGGGAWGSDDAGDWTTVFTGEVPQAHGRPEEPVSLAVDFGGMPVRYVVMTTTTDPALLNWSAQAGYSGITDAGVGEVRFYTVPPNDGAAIFIR